MSEEYKAGLYFPNYDDRQNKSKSHRTRRKCTVALGKINCLFQRMAITPLPSLPVLPMMAVMMVMMAMAMMMVMMSHPPAAETAAVMMMVMARA